MNLFFLLIILDLNQVFSYEVPTDNPYYVEASNHHEFYIATLQKLAKYHAYEKLKKLSKKGTDSANIEMMDEEQEEVERLIDQQRALLCEEPDA